MTLLRHALPLLLVLGLLSSLAATCEEQDFYIFEDPFLIEQSRTSDSDRFTHASRVGRHNLDYRILNTNPTATTVVVLEARSFLSSSSSSSTLRGEGRQVFSLEGGAELTGRISELELKLGDLLEVNLQCCEASACNPSEVECPDSCEGYPLTTCLQGCRDEVDDDNDAEAIRRSSCENDQCLVSCLDSYQFCCIGSTGELDPACLVPCGLPDTFTDFACAPADISCPSSGSGCQGFLTRCVTGCEDPSIRTCDREQCVEACLFAFDQLGDCCAQSTSCDTPCCFAESSSCHAEVEAVAKVSPIECLDDDSVCSSEQICNDRGLCENKVREATSSCSTLPRRNSSSPLGGPLVLILLGLLARQQRALRAAQRGERGR